MNNLPWFPLDAKQWLVGTAGMTKAEKGVFIDLLCYQWENGSLSSIPSRLPIECANEWPVLQLKFTECISGELVNPKLYEIRLEKEALLNKQVEGGRKGARLRYGSPTRKAIGIQSKSKSKSKKSEQEPEKKKEEKPFTAYEQKLANFFDSIPEQQLVIWERAYPGIDIAQCILEARAYAFSNTQKGYKNLNKFVNGWLSRDNKKVAKNDDFWDDVKDGSGGLYK